MKITIMELLEIFKKKKKLYSSKSLEIIAGLS